MQITSFYYFLFLTISVFIYYIFPKTIQWIWLLIVSVSFYFLSAAPYTILYLIISTATAYAATRLIECLQSKNNEKPAKAVLIIALSINILIWFRAKGTDLYNPIFQALHIPVPREVIASLGMGYYTAQIIGYILDCYWNTIKPEKNPFKLFLFVSFFPQLISGPISRFGKLKDLYAEHRFSIEKIEHGCQRILFGLFKKLVIAERVGIIVNGIYADTEAYAGFYLWLALLLFPLQMYTDFSGCMDIVLGTAELFDIKLEENFNNPFFARTNQEFWQRWHITLGTWAKDYVLYPLLKTNFFINFGKLCKKKFGKKIGKKIPTTIGMFCLWLVMGIWHGGIKYIIGVSLWYWLLLTMSDFAAPLFQKFKLEDSFSVRLFQRMRTYFIYAVGALFFRAPSIKEALKFINGLFLTFKDPNPWIFFNKDIYSFGIERYDVDMIILGIAILIFVGIAREKYGYARTWMDKQLLPFRWVVWIGLFLLVLIYGKYGPSYNAAAFIYKGF